jgi:hypothetical protein
VATRRRLGDVFLLRVVLLGLRFGHGFVDLAVAREQAGDGSADCRRGKNAVRMDQNEAHSALTTAGPMRPPPGSLSAAPSEPRLKTFRTDGTPTENVAMSSRAHIVNPLIAPQPRTPESQPARMPPINRQKIHEIPRYHCRWSRTPAISDPKASANHRIARRASRPRARTAPANTTAQERAGVHCAADRRHTSPRCPPARRVVAIRTCRRSHVDAGD